MSAVSAVAVLAKVFILICLLVLIWVNNQFEPSSHFKDSKSGFEAMPTKTSTDWIKIILVSSVVLDLISFCI